MRAHALLHRATRATRRPGPDRRGDRGLRGGPRAGGGPDQRRDRGDGQRGDPGDGQRGRRHRGQTAAATPRTPSLPSGFEAGQGRREPQGAVADRPGLSSQRRGPARQAVQARARRPVAGGRGGVALGGGADGTVAALDVAPGGRPTPSESDNGTPRDLGADADALELLAQAEQPRSPGPGEARARTPKLGKLDPTLWMDGGEPAVGRRTDERKVAHRRAAGRTLAGTGAVGVLEDAAGEIPKVPLPGRYYRYREDVIERFERGRGPHHTRGTEGELRWPPPTEP